MIGKFWTFLQSKIYFLKKPKKDKNIQAFSLVEILIVLAIIGILGSIVITSIPKVYERVYYVKAKKEFKTMVEALELYHLDNNDTYPADANRNIPPGLEDYINVGDWPDAPWPGSVYDWDNWASNALAYDPKVQTYQISIRFCPIGQPQNCKFPEEDWADDFDINSAIYYCISGSCRSHSSKPINHPGYCINCEN